MGACRLCIVEVAGVGRLLPACTTPVQDGMSVTTHSEKLTQYRRMALEFLLSERNHQCAVCVSNNHCELQSLAQSLGVTHVRYPYSFPKLPVDISHERYVLDHNRCILCTRCVRVCAEVEGAHVWDISWPRHPVHDCLRHEPAVGRVAELHQLRQVRAGLPHRRAGRKRLRRGGDGEAGPQRQAPGRQARRPCMKKVRLATVWLDGCSGCHMSLLDMDEAILNLARRVDVVYGPLVDAQEFPKAVDVTLVEGAVSSQEDLEKIRTIRQRSKLLVALGDCAVTGNVSGHAQPDAGAQAAGAHLRGGRAGQSR